LRKAVATSVSVREAIGKLGLVPAGGNYKLFRLHVDRLALDTSHFLGQAANRGRKFTDLHSRSLESILHRGIKYTNTSSLKRRLLQAGRLENKCAWCGISEWRGAPLSLHLDHINGDNLDHCEENLRLLCPNCHSQTKTYCGKRRRA
jgi:Zn finger protein HypA/HybF involved in hydrogenase expression